MAEDWHGSTSYPDGCRISSEASFEESLSESEVPFSIIPTPAAAQNRDERGKPTGIPCILLRIMQEYG